ncbi:MAG: S8 family serine peptidase, partial [Halolamina sp.]
HTNFEVKLTKTVATADAPNATDGVEQVNAPDAWNTTRGEGASVAVLDTGVDGSHPDINVSKFVTVDENGTVNRTEPFDTATHGTHVSGTVVGGNASGEYIGVAPEAELLHAQVIDGDTGSFVRVLAGLEWAVNQSADVTVMSLGADIYADEFIEPVENARAAGTVVVASSGNYGPNTSASPGNVPGVLSVGAVDDDGRVAPFSSGEIVNGSVWENGTYEDYVVPTVVAPGVNVTSSASGGGYEQLSGTSMAAPHVGGTVALVFAAGENVSVSEAEAAVVETARKPDFADAVDTRYGNGVIDAEAAVRQVSNGTVAGQVLDSQGDPVTGATVSVGGVTTTTNATGSFEVATLPGSQPLSVDAAGYETETQTVTVAEGERTTVEVTATAPATYHFDLAANESYAIGIPGPVEGTVAEAFYTSDGDTPTGVVYAYDRDADEWYRPSANASLSQFDALAVTVEEDATAVLRFKSDANGTVTPADVELKTGWNFVAPPMRGTPTEIFGLGTIEPARILDTHDGAPSVAVHGEDVTGAVEYGAGNDELSPFNGYFIYAEENGSVAGATYEGMTRPEANTNLEMNTTTVTGTVVDSNGTPVEGASVTVAGTDLGATTGPNGTFEVTGVAVDATDVPLRATAHGYGNATATADAGTDVGQLQLTTGSDIQVTNASVAYVNGSYELTATVANAGDVAGDRTVNLSVDSLTASESIIATRNVSLESGAERTLSFTLNATTVSEAAFGTVTAGQSFATVRLGSELTAPKVQNASTVDNQTIAVTFDRPIDLAKGDASGINVTVDGFGVQVTASAENETLLLTLDGQLDGNETVRVTYSGEAGNIVSADTRTEAGAFEVRVRNTAG